MEENNRKGPGIFYAVVGVATLVVAIIGATFAYFSASISDNGLNVRGKTQNINGASLSLNVKKVVFTGAEADYNTLVPAWFGMCEDGDNLTYGCTEADDTTIPVTAAGIKVTDPSHLTDTELASMLSNKCEKDGFTGCHVYRIDISADQDITHANLNLGLSVVNPASYLYADINTQWGYAIFTADGTVDMTDGNTAGQTSGLSNGTLVSSGFGIPAAIGNGFAASTRTDIHHDGSLTTNTTVTYYLLIYVNDDNTIQNAVGTPQANYVRGSYSGILELQALGGKVRATFSA